MITALRFGTLSNKPSNNNPTSPVFVLSGPMGVGKDWVFNALQAQLREAGLPEVYRTRSLTTRPLRNDADKAARISVPLDEFRRMKDNGELVEWVEVPGITPKDDPVGYGMPRTELEAAWQKGQVPYIECDVAGLKQFKHMFGDRISSVFLLPEGNPRQFLATRMRIRQPDMPDAELERRLTINMQELEKAKEPGLYQHFFVNSVSKETASKLVTLWKDAIAGQQQALKAQQSQTNEKKSLDLLA